MSEWISVKDRLPEPDSKVLVYISDKVIDTCVFLGEEKEYKWRGYVSRYITHWQPLPPPPD